jgi:serine/threonine-protein kinase RsbW
MLRRLSTRMVKSTFRANFESLEAIREFVGRSAEQSDLSEREIYAVQLATDEAVTNIIQHAFGGEGENEIEIECEVNPGKLIITLNDRGRAFDPSSVQEPNVKANLKDRKIGGLGMYLIRNMMDEVIYSSTPEDGNTLRLVKHSEGVS